MKRVKVLALLAAMVMLLSACNAINVTKVATVGDAAVYKPEFMYYLEMAKSEAYQVAQSQGAIIAKEADWNTVMIEDKTAAQYAKDKALENVRSILVMEAKAKEAGYVMTDADLEEVQNQKSQVIAQLGGRYGYEQSLDQMGISIDEFNALIERGVYASLYMNKLATEDPAIKPAAGAAAEKLNNEYVYVRHILISNQPTEENLELVDENGEAIEEPAADPKQEAENVLAQLAAGGDFVALMNEYSDDSRDEEGNLASDGYIMTNNGQMVKEFEDAAMSLVEGAYTTELVETAYGYHIIKRYALPTEGTQYDEAIASITSDLTSENVKKQVDIWAGEMGFTANDKYIGKLKIKMED